VMALRVLLLGTPIVRVAVRSLAAIHHNVDLGRGDALRSTWLTRSSAPTPRAVTVRRSSSSLTPACRSAPSIMSPLIPEKHSKYAIRIRFGLNDFSCENPSPSVREVTETLFQASRRPQFLLW